ncbi:MULTISPECIES: dTDP-4-dehydrorhamnose reductase [Pseudomonas]|uniref:dTDP-4-dehydrorhamnose reductase n=1 Tax=Pseudomonas TaxID=286 RepID=UPI001E54B9B0|nr:MULTISPECIES: dTDP-4-dehydrorhamnose reductase [Pseudomonas]MCE4068982.1 dTDP-4-dehydrorhamnose reductase [Pseudomonas nitritireducens]MCE4078171.1 dTDP-4-dehydrorhamnose reductase [Pseudomonas nitroreducens]
MNKILLLGANGQVGWELQRALSPLARLVVCDRARADLSNSASLERLLDKEHPDFIVNAGAYTAVDKAEHDEDNARRVNCEAVSTLAGWAFRNRAWLVHYSTDYVFDGSGDQPFDEDAPTGPLGVYGQTKLEGELAIRSSGCQHLIFRTSWVYASRGANFAKTMLRLAKERDQLRVIADQVGSPTSAELIADITALVLSRLSVDPKLRERAAGTYHLVASGETSWYRYAQFTIAEAIRQGCELRATPECVTPITTAEYPLPARRPANSRLANEKLQRTFRLELPDWEYHVSRMVRELVGQGAL